MRIRKKKLETIKSISGVGKDVDMINMEINTVKSELSYSKQRSEELTATLNNHGLTQEEIDKYSEPADVTALNKSLEAVSAAQANWDKISLQVSGFKQQRTNLNNSIDVLDKKIADLHRQIQEASEDKGRLMEELIKTDNNIAIGDKWFADNARPESKEIMDAMSNATHHNTMHQRIVTLSSQKKEEINMKSKVDELKEKIKNLEKKRGDVISGSQLNIPGLTFTEDGLFIDGLPLEEGQVNTQRLWDIGVDIAIALNPNYKVIFLNDGSLFDKQHLKSIVDKIEEKGYMAIIEVVNFEGGELDVKFTEDVI